MKLTTDISTFRSMITGNYIYVDKTKYIYDLFTGGSRYYFLSRPRRFGKTLLISTLKEFFEGNNQLFKKLWIGASDWSWDKHPVIYLDFSVIAHKTPEELELSLIEALDDIAKENNVEIAGITPTSKFKNLVRELSKKNQVVILVDEYDKPILDHINDTTVAEKQREVLKNFYDTLKGLDSHLRALFITGVSKFSKTSIFSGLNTLNDISFKPEASILLGYTIDEINSYFSSFIDQVSIVQNKSNDEITNDMRQWYNGYRFSSREIKVYNPFSISFFLTDKIFKNYWFESGTPTFLIDLLKKQSSSIINLSKIEIGLESLTTFEISNIPLIPLLFQTGYLTIDTYNESTNKVTLGFPNLEVEQAFNKYLITVLTGSFAYETEEYLTLLKNALLTSDLKRFVGILKTLLSDVPNSLGPKESNYHMLFHMIIKLISSKVIYIYSEVLTNEGRIDSVIEIDNYIYIFEFKLKVNPEAALRQIKDKQYYQPYMFKNKQIILVGLSFESNPFNINYKEEKLII